MPSLTTVLRDAFVFVLTWPPALLLLGFLHGDWMLGWAAVVAALSTAVRKTALRALPVPGTMGWSMELASGSLAMLVASLLTLGGHPWAYLVLRWRESLVLAAAAFAVALSLVGVVSIGRAVAKQAAEREGRIAALREHALTARLSALQAQIQPHFLFNTLNTLAELVHEDAHLAEDMITDLAEMMRFNLRCSVSGVLLSEELDTTQRYLRIETARLGEARLRVELDIEPDCLEISVPGLLVQPLVENAVQHAVAPRPEGGTVRIRTWSTDTGVCVEVSDDGPGLPAAVLAELDSTERPSRGTAGAGGALHSVKQRLALAWPTDQARLIATTDSDGTCLTLHLPRPPQAAT
jgi:signal transduction histidine kinase